MNIEIKIRQGLAPIENIRLVHAADHVVVYYVGMALPKSQFARAQEDGAGTFFLWFMPHVAYQPKGEDFTEEQLEDFELIAARGTELVIGGFPSADDLLRWALTAQYERYGYYLAFIDREFKGELVEFQTCERTDEGENNDQEDPSH